MLRRIVIRVSIVGAFMSQAVMALSSPPSAPSHEEAPLGESALRSTTQRRVRVSEAQLPFPPALCSESPVGLVLRDNNRAAWLLEDGTVVLTAGVRIERELTLPKPLADPPNALRSGSNDLVSYMPLQDGDSGPVNVVLDLQTGTKSFRSFDRTSTRRILPISDSSDWVYSTHALWLVKDGIQVNVDLGPHLRVHGASVAAGEVALLATAGTMRDAHLELICVGADGEVTTRLTMPRGYGLTIVHLGKRIAVASFEGSVLLVDPEQQTGEEIILEGIPGNEREWVPVQSRADSNVLWLWRWRSCETRRVDLPNVSRVPGNDESPDP